MVCQACGKEITDENAYQSKQVGMEGYYHWKCFVARCKRSNKIGAQQIEGVSVSSGLYGNLASGDIGTGTSEDD